MKTNILLLVADQLRADSIGCAGMEDVLTPNIDKLAANGVRFANAYTPIPVCAPARQALLSGLNPDSFGAMWNYDFFMTPTLAPGATWSEALAAEGYACSFIGRWHNSATHSPEAFGYSNVCGGRYYSEMIAKKYPGLKLDPSWLGCPNPVALEDSNTHYLAARAVEAIEAADGAPWHVRVDFSDPHLPCRPSAPFSEMYKPEDMKPWAGFGDKFKNKPYIHAQQPLTWGIAGKPWEYFAPMKARYFGMISQIDDAVGRIIATLEKRGELRNTLVIFTSDHGDMCGSHGMLDKHYTMYEDVVRVPLIMAHGGMPQGICRELVSNCLDLSPTIREFTGLGSVKTHGKSLLPLLNGQKGRKYISSSANGQQFGLFTQRMLTDGLFKYVWNLTDTDEFYDLARDAGEKENLIRDPRQKERVALFRRELWQTLREQEDRFVMTSWLEGQLLRGEKN